MVVRSSTANEDLDLMVDQLALEFLEGTNDALEGGSDVGEVGNTSTNDEDLALGVGCTAGDEVDCVAENLVNVNEFDEKNISLMVLAYS